jgi:hybrid cluster-associated redox disulfide protein
VKLFKLGRGDYMEVHIDVTKDSIIGDVIKAVPGADKVIEKYFGTGCFTCPGINMESIAFGATMHNIDPEKIVEDIKKLTGKRNE